MDYGVPDGRESTSTITVSFHPCSVCGRTFKPESLSRHESICAKNASKKRQKFDSSKQRRQGTDMEQFNSVPSKKGHRSAQPPPKPVSNKTGDWRRKHEEFIAAIRSARGVTAALKSGGPLPPPPPPAENPDYVKCDYCQRRFKEEVAERHVPFCREKAQRIGQQPPQAAKDKLHKRNTYKPPLPGTRQRPVAAADRSASQAHGMIPGGGARPQTQQQAPTGGHYRRPSQQRQLNGRTAPNSYPEADGQTSARSTRGTSSSSSSSSLYSGHQRGAAASRPRQPSSVVAAGVDDLRRASQASYGRPPPSKNGTYTLNGELDYQSHNQVNDVSSHQSSRSSSRARQRLEAARAHSRAAEEREGSASTSGFSDMSSSSERSLPPISRYPRDNGHRGNEAYSSPPHPHVAAYARDMTGPAASRHGSGTAKPAGKSKFCYECGSQFPVAHAKFCCECGTRRI